MATIDPLPISTLGDSYSGLLPDTFSTYSAVKPTSDFIAFDPNASVASPTDRSTSLFHDLSNLVSSVGTTTASILRATGVTPSPQAAPTVGSSIASQAKSSPLVTLAIIGAVAIVAVLLIQRVGK